MAKNFTFNRVVSYQERTLYPLLVLLTNKIEMKTNPQIRSA